MHDAALGGTLSVINPAAQTLTTVTVGNSTYAVAVSPSGANVGDAYVAKKADNTVSVIGPANTVLTTIPVAGNPYGVAISPPATSTSPTTATPRCR